MKKTILFLGIGLILFTSSCKKDDSNDETNNTNPTTKACLVTKVINKDSSYTEVTYNSSNLVSKIRNYDSTATLTDGLDLSYSNDKLSTINSISSNNETDAIFKYSYIGNNIKLYYLTDQDNDDEIDDTTAVYDYYVSTNLDSITITYGALLYKKFVFNWNGNNIALAKKYIYDLNTNNLEFSGSYEYEYDANNNFKKGLGIDYLIFEDDFSTINANNLTKAIEKDETGTTDNYSSRDYFNEYDSDNRIIKTTSVSFLGDTLNVETYTYSCN